MPKTGNNVNEKLTLKTGNNKRGGWDVALDRACKALKNNKLQAARLRSAILFFKENIDKDSPWPGENSGNG